VGEYGPVLPFASDRRQPALNIRRDGIYVRGLSRTSKTSIHTQGDLNFSGESAARTELFSQTTKTADVEASRGPYIRNFARILGQDLCNIFESIFFTQQTLRKDSYVAKIARILAQDPGQGLCRGP
jgi:hypothetical protein